MMMKSNPVNSEDAIEILMQQMSPVMENESCIEVLEKFHQDKNITALPVVNINNSPVGIVLRQELVEFFSKPFSKELNGKKPISALMARAPVVVDKKMMIEDVSRIILDSGMKHMVSGFIISHGNEYIGMGNGYDLLNEITNRKQKHLFEMAHFDQLTGLPNRRLFLDRLEQELKKSNRNGESLALMFIDLDRFKDVNDTFGHERGDELLREVAIRISSLVRETDTVSRLGGDEFTVIMNTGRDRSHVEQKAQEIIGSLSRPFRWTDGQESHISASIGIAIYPDDADNLQQLQQHADQAMYAAKAAGRDGFRYFMPAMQMAAVERMHMINDLRHALQDKQLEVYYQPIVDMKSRRVVKAEALLRWHHPTKGMISPATFIPLAEESGLILEIGEWVFLEAIRTIEKWKISTGKIIPVSVNKSPVQFIKGDFHPWLQQLATSWLPKGSIIVEITEGLILNDSIKVREELSIFKNLGIEVSIDDFGTGFSSLSCLSQFDIDYLKIDRSFIKNMNENKSNRALTEAIIVMAHKLGIKAIAEGVETETQRDLLISYECDYIQAPIQV
jgi:diguanylate cyclase (GGDEF)-like protein